MNTRWNIPADQDLTIEEIIKQGGYYDIDGLWNNITQINGELYRGRAETFVIDQEGKIYMQLTNDGGYRIPGGSFERDSTHTLQAQAEVLEEAKIVCDNVTYTGVHYIRTFDKIFKDKPGRVYWKGTYNEVFVADYVKQFIGVIHPKNRDNEMYNLGKWYSYDEIKHLLSDPHKEALSELYNRPLPIPKTEVEESEKKLNEKINNINELYKQNDSLYIDNDNIINENNVENNNTNNLSFFLPEEMHELGVMNEGHNFYSENTPIDNYTRDWFEKYEKEINNRPEMDWFNTVNKLYNEYKKTNGAEIKQKILNLGWNPEVPFTYNNVKKATDLAEKRKESKEIIEIQENYIFNKNDNVYNFDDWDSGKSNILLITGLSGSGKTTMAFTLAKEYDAIVIQLDHLQCYERFRDNNYKMNSEDIKLVDKFLKSHKEYETSEFNSITLDSFKSVFDIFFPWLLKTLEKDKKHRYIVEGIHILLFTKYSDIKKYPLICINTPTYKSMIRHWIRDRFTLAELAKYGINDIRLFKDWEGKYQDFYNSMNESLTEFDKYYLENFVL